jgi:biotin synthase
MSLDNNVDIQISINDDKRHVQRHMTIYDLLVELDINPGSVAVERNKEIIENEQYDEIYIQENDSLEIVRFIGGGSKSVSSKGVVYSLQSLYEKSKKGYPLTQEEGEFLINVPDDQLDQLMAYAFDLMTEKVGRGVLMCGIENAKSGSCSEDCSFCSQSAHHDTQSLEYAMKPKDSLVEAAKLAKYNHASCFSLVTSGKGAPLGKDFEVIKEALGEVKHIHDNRCTSMGVATRDQLRELKEAGLNKYHHNLEAAESFFPEVCSTHSFQERIETIRDAKEIGLRTCCGGIFGLGESVSQRVELGLTLKELDVESIPLNIVHPIEGTRIYGKVSPLRVEDILKLIATFRFIMPEKIIGVFGGREVNLKENQRLLFEAGANGILIGNYLTTKGDSVSKDLAMIKSVGLEPTYPNVVQSKRAG